jgi:heptosyltransferase-2
MVLRARRRDFRKSSSYFLALASELASPFLGLAGTVVTGTPTRKESWRRGLIISHTHIGDLLYRTPSLPHLSSSLPDCKWDYLASPSSASVLSQNPNISKVHPFVKGEDSWNLDSVAFGELRRQKYDVALCTNTLRHYPDFALAVALGIPNRVGFADRGLSGLLTHRIVIERPQPFPAYFREMVKQLGGLAGDWPLRPSVTITDDSAARAKGFIERTSGEDDVLVACCPTTRQPSGSWPADFFVDVVNAVSDTVQIRVVLCGAADERTQLAAAGLKLTAPNFVMAGDLDIISFAALLSRCSLVFAQDSAARHLGNAVGTPVIFLRNLAVNPVESGAYCDSEEDLAPSEGLLNGVRIEEARGRLSVPFVAGRIVARLRAKMAR